MEVPQLDAQAGGLDLRGLADAVGALTPTR